MAARRRRDRGAARDRRPAVRRAVAGPRRDRRAGRDAVPADPAGAAAAGRRDVGRGARAADGPPAELAARGRTLRAGETIDRDAVAALLVAAGWSRTPIVDEPGTFAVRGGVIDVFSPLSPHPVRIELFGDEIESLRAFEAESQRTLKPVDLVHLCPVRETIPTGARDVRARLRAYADDIAFPTKATRRLIEQLEAGEVFVGIEGLLPAFHDELVPPAAYVPADARWLVVDPDAGRRAIGELWTDAEARYAARPGVDTKERTLAYPPERHLAAADEAGAFTAARRIELPTLELHDPASGPAAGVVHLRAEVDDLHLLRQELEHARTFGDTEHVEPLVTRLAAWREQQVRVVIASDSQSRTDRLYGVLAGRRIDVRLAAPAEVGTDGPSGARPWAADARPGAAPGVTIVPGAPAHGFASPRDGVAVVTCADIFGQRTHHPGARTKRAKDALLGGVADFSQLAPGDHLVHQRHGVGRYAGLQKLAVGTVSLFETTAVGAAAPALHEIDALKLEYDGGTLYLPVYRLGEVQRYVGAEGHAPKLDKLGGQTWEVTRSKVARHVRALAEELLQLYAQRAALPGHRFPPPTTATASSRRRSRSTRRRISSPRSRRCSPTWRRRARWTAWSAATSATARPRSRCARCSAPCWAASRRRSSRRPRCSSSSTTARWWSGSAASR
jgi:transcription-repair coupling factor (superfamily II helicase)